MNWFPRPRASPRWLIRPMLGGRRPRAPSSSRRRACSGCGSNSTMRVPEIDTAYATLMRDRPDALFVAADAFFSSRRVQLISLAARHALPAIYSAREFVEGGGLISYGTSIADMYRQV